ncbi:hypothetical protein GF342_02075 [Candidatus Woesearchaeota archaeon]|nr:hypothetical protein [Candidatus Woesearchaeota archaeon]
MASDPDEVLPRGVEIDENPDTKYRVDLQVHTKWSDGYLTPDVLLDRANNPQRLISVISFTDHDTTRGYDTPGLRQLKEGYAEGILRRVTEIEFSDGHPHTKACCIDPADPGAPHQGMPLLEYQGPPMPVSFMQNSPATDALVASYRTFLIQGAEISTRLDGRRFDLLAYFMPASDPWFNEVFERQVEPREKRAKLMVDDLREQYKWPITMQEVLSETGIARRVFQPHIASAILYLRDDNKIDIPRHWRISDVITEYLSPGCDAYHPINLEVLPTTQEVIERLLILGAVPVMPYSKSCDSVATMRLLQEWACGLMGAEVVNLRSTKEQIDDMRKAVTENGVQLETSGSDFHGLYHDRKDRRKLGVPATEPYKVLENLIKHRQRIQNR